MKSRITLKVSILISCAVVSISACSRSALEPTPNLELIVARTQTSMALDQLLTTTSVVLTQAQTQSPSITNTPPKFTPTLAEIECKDQAELISETIPPGTTFDSGETFDKTWVLRNSGTCPWNNQYALVFDHGEQFGADLKWLGEDVPPGDEIIILLSLTAPQDIGDYEGYWYIQNANGHQFGTGQNGETALGVRIRVAEMDQPLILDDPNWIDTFDQPNQNWNLGADEYTDFEIVDGKLSVTALKSAGDQWRIAQVGYIDDFYLEAEFISGDVCNGKDSYGVLVRAPDQEDNILDSGYVFVISCDGYFRAYLLVNGTFVNLINWSRSPEINLGPNQRNILGIRAIENDYQLYVNNAQLYEFEDTTFATGNFGISIRSDTTQNFQAFVEQISLWTEFD